MHKIICPSCNLTFTDADKEWDSIQNIGHCHQCSKKLTAKTSKENDVRKAEETLRKPHSKTIACLIFLLFLAGSAALLKTSFHYGSLIYKAAVTSKDWKVTKAKLLSSSIEKGCGLFVLNQENYTINVNYIYQIGDDQYQNQQIVFGKKQCSSKLVAEKNLKKYVSDDFTLIAYYNPANKAESVLSKTMGGNSEIIFCILSLILAMYCLRSLVYFFKVMHNPSFKRDS